MSDLSGLSCKGRGIFPLVSMIHPHRVRARIQGSSYRRLSSRGASTRCRSESSRRSTSMWRWPRWKRWSYHDVQRTSWGRRSACRKAYRAKWSASWCHRIWERRSQQPVRLAYPLFLRYLTQRLPFKSWRHHYHHRRCKRSPYLRHFWYSSRQQPSASGCNGTHKRSWPVA